MSGCEAVHNGESLTSEALWNVGHSTATRLKKGPKCADIRRKEKEIAKIFLSKRFDHQAFRCAITSTTLPNADITSQDMCFNIGPVDYLSTVLPFELKQRVLSLLGLRDLRTMCSVSRGLRKNAGDAIRFRVCAIFRIFVDEPNALLEVMGGLHAIVSGSSALLALTDVLFTPNDLDIYLPQENGDALLAWFEDRGYKAFNERTLRTNSYSTMQSTLASVYRLSKTGIESGPVINVLTTRRRSVLNAIIDYDFTFVMNFISSRGVGSLYWDMTDEKIGINNSMAQRNRTTAESKSMRVEILEYYLGLVRDINWSR
ncbi:hypothetical protein NP233_g4411 [Leucocoprinus birnbaumii]|uniref:F-box domain-containing protein n=1 Tax=Leucocoprinus birnbaumii TaxID=56174 RepID=A0AAD5VVD3_9AGAR|nr:hypothetical protein NP233_g4411 [Leucocoprinus birnbaumii]